VGEKTIIAQIRNLIMRFAADKSGATAIEYAMVATIMALVAITYGDIFDNLRDNFMQPTNDALTGQ